MTCSVPSCPNPADEYGFMCIGHWTQVPMPLRDRVVESIYIENRFADREQARADAVAAVDDSQQMRLI